jgi:hypothetical protein
MFRHTYLHFFRRFPSYVLGRVYLPLFKEVYPPFIFWEGLPPILLESLPSIFLEGLPHPINFLFSFYPAMINAAIAFFQYYKIISLYNYLLL